MKRLTTHIKNFTNVLHIGDIHIRLMQRHQEYTETFQKLYKAVEKTPQSTLIVVAGDILHNKSDLSPESVSLAGEFLKNLSDKRPTILIAGNHDATLANKNRLDSLSPIVDALNHNNLYYLKNTDIYIIGDILLNNYGVFEDPDKYVKYKDIPSIYKNEVNYNIALFHGPVNNAVTDVGYIVSNNTITTSIFDGHQMVMLGDIHRHQVLQQYDDINDKPAIVYCGSLVQQDHGESLKGHGFVYWDLKTKRFAHIEIPNDYGFYTIEVNKGKLTTDIKDIPKKAKLRIKCSESIPTEIKSVLLEVRKSSDITDVSYVRVEDPIGNKNIIDVTNVNLQNVSDVDYQNNLIKKYLNNKNINVNDESLNCIYQLNKELNNELKREYVVRNIRWKPKTLQFDNMFSYGEDNIIDFTKMNGIMGLFANNASGKSSILSALSFCLFDKCDRAFKASHILNTQKMSFRCKFNFEINGKDFFIERKGVADKKGNVKVDVKFWKEDDGKEIELNGEARRSTNDIIRDYIGDYEDFILTVLSIQNGKDGSFIDMGQTERKDLLAQFMGLTIFDKLCILANDKYKEVNILLKNFKNDDYTLKLNNIINKIDSTKSSITKENIELDDLSTQKDNANNRLIELTKQLVNIDSKICDIIDLEKQKVKYTSDISKLEMEEVENRKNINDIDVKIDKLNGDINKILVKDLTINLEKYQSVKQMYDLSERTIEKGKILIKNKLEKLSKLEEHKYDPTCDYCINNVFVKDAIKTKEELEQDKNKIISLMEAFKNHKKDMDSLQWVLEDDKTLKIYNDEKTKLSEKHSKLNNTLLRNENTINQYKNILTSLNQDIDNFYKQKDNIEKNKKIADEISIVKTNIKNLDYNYKIKNKTIIDLNTSLQGNINEKTTIEESIKKVKELESKNDCFKYYIQSINRDGIPYDLITQSLPSIEKEVNDILHQIVEFTVSLETDGKNVSTYIVYNDKKWPLEMGSGMEKFISSLAIRVSLITISNLPRPNFMAIDEGFGCADKDNLAAMSNLFSYLKTQFDFIWIISHLDEMRDMVDKHIEIKKENGFSKIVFN